jgi:hypothetical protein
MAVRNIRPTPPSSWLFCRTWTSTKVLPGTSNRLLLLPSQRRSPLRLLALPVPSSRPLCDNITTATWKTMNVAACDGDRSIQRILLWLQGHPQQDDLYCDHAQPAPTLEDHKSRLKFPLPTVRKRKFLAEISPNILSAAAPAAMSTNVPDAVTIYVPDKW